MGEIDLDYVSRSFVGADQLRGRAKGQALERVVVDIFSQVPGLILVSHDVRDAAGAEEIDIGFRNLRPDNGLTDFGAQLLVECKNWDRPISSEQVAWFVHKLSHAQQRSGILVAAMGVTGDPTLRTHAQSEIYAARLSQPAVNVVVVTRNELERIPNTDALVELLHRKLFNVIVHGAFYEDVSIDNAEPPHGTPTRAASVRPMGAEAIASIDAARLLPSDVAARFAIAPSMFALARPCNTALVGPRGAGKTAMLRTLQAHVLDDANSPAARVLRDILTYVTVYVPLSTLDIAKTVGRFGEGSMLMAITAGTAMERLTEEFSRQLGEQENDDDHRRVTNRELARRLSEAWELRAARPESLADLVIALRKRRIELIHAASTPATRDLNDLRDLVTGTTADLYVAAVVGITAFNEIAPKRRQWCLALDDVDSLGPELAPEVFKWMRTTDPDLFLKFACTPSASRQSVSGVTSLPMMDYDVVSLPEADSYGFGVEMLREAAIRFGVKDPSPDRIFGRTDVGSNLSDVVARLASVDASFAEWADRTGVNTNPRTPAASAQLRRVSHLIAVRENALKRANGNEVLLRSRRTPTWCTGSPTVLQLFDGVPRMLTVFLERVLPLVDEVGRVPAAVQAREITSLTNQFVALLGAIHVPKSEKTVLDVLDLIGMALARSVVGPIFTPDPVLSVIVDGAVDEEIRRGVTLAVDLGAAFSVSRHDAQPRIRIAHILAPRYRLPIQLGRATPLSGLIK